MGEFVGDDAFEFGAVHLVEEAGGDGHRRVVDIAARGKGVGSRIVDHVNLGFGDSGGDRNGLDQIVEP